MAGTAPASSRSPSGFLRLISRPALYVGWTIVSFVGLAVTWPLDPWLFALATLVVGLGTIGMGLAGILAQVKAAPEIRTRIIIAGSITASGLLVALALVMLSRVRWA